MADISMDTCEFWNLHSSFDMSQYKEEQVGEIFSLECIYPDELESKYISYNDYNSNNQYSQT